MGLTDAQLQAARSCAAGLAREVLTQRSTGSWRRNARVGEVPRPPWMALENFSLGPKGLVTEGFGGLVVSWATLWQGWSELYLAQEGAAVDLSQRGPRAEVDMTLALAHLTLRLAPAVRRYARGMRALVQEPHKTPTEKVLEGEAASLAGVSWGNLAARGPEAFRTLLGDPTRMALCQGGEEGKALVLSEAPGMPLELPLEALEFWLRCLVAELTAVPDVSGRVARAAALRKRLAPLHGHPVDAEGWPTPGVEFAAAGRMRALWLGRAQGAGLVLSVPAYTVREYRSGRDVSFAPSKLLLATARWPDAYLSDAAVLSTTGQDHFFVSDERLGALQGEDLANVCLGGSGSILAGNLTQGLGGERPEVRQVALLTHAQRTLQRGYFLENTQAIYAGGRRIVARLAPTEVSK